MLRKLVLLIICLVIFSLKGFAEDKMKIAVMDLEAKDVPQTKASIVSDFLRNDLFSSNKYVIVERSQMEKILNEQKFQMAGCTSTECAVEIGKILNVSQMIVGSLSMLGGEYFLMIRLVDVETAETKFSETLSCKAESELKDVSKSLIAKLTGAEVINKSFIIPSSTGETSPLDVAWRSALLPGWGQIANGQELKGYSISIAEILAVGGAVTTYFLYNKAVDDYNSAGTGADFDSLATNAQNLNNLNKICFWTAVGVWAFGVIDPYVLGINKDKNFTLDYNNDKVQLAYSIKF